LNYILFVAYRFLFWIENCYSIQPELFEDMCDADHDLIT
jgi:hypothetical protein